MNSKLATLQQATLIKETNNKLLEKLAGISYYHKLDPERWEDVLADNNTQILEITCAATTSGYLGGLQGAEYLAAINQLVARGELIKDFIGIMRLVADDPNYFES